MGRRKADELEPGYGAPIDDRPPLGISSAETIAWVRQYTDWCLLAFSGGKDSIAAALTLKEAGMRVVPYFMYLYPGLRVEEEAMGYYERTLFDGEHIVRVPHISLYRWINELVAAPPDHMILKVGCRFPTLDNYAWGDALACECKGINYDYRVWVANGVRSADSPIRRMALSKYGTVTFPRQLFYPIHDLRAVDVEALLVRHNVKLPPAYRHFGRSFDGIDFRFMVPLAEHYPDDYRKLRHMFPLIETEWIRRGMTPPQVDGTEDTCRGS